MRPSILLSQAVWIGDNYYVVSMQNNYSFTSDSLVCPGGGMKMSSKRHDNAGMRLCAKSDTMRPRCRGNTLPTSASGHYQEVPELLLFFVLKCSWPFSNVV